MDVLLEGSPISTEELYSSVSDHWVLGHLPDQGPSPLIAQFGQLKEESWWQQKIFSLKMMDSTVFLGTFNAAEMFWYPSPDLCLNTILSGALWTIPSTSMLGLCSDMHCQLWDL